MQIVVVEPTPAGGLFQYSLQLAEALAARGHDVELLTGPDPEFASRHPRLRVLAVLPTWHPAAGVDDPAGVRRVRRVWRAVRYLEAWRRAAVHVRRTRPDAVLFGEWRFALDGVALRALRAWARPRLVADVAHTPRPFSEERAGQRSRQRSGADASIFKGGGLLLRSLDAAYRRTDVVFVLGEASYRAFDDAFGPVTRVVEIPHGDEGIYADAGLGAAGEQDEVVLFFGGLARYKGLDLLLDAFARVRAERPAARLLLAGPVVDVDVDELRARVASLQGAELRAGYVPAGAVPELVGSARVVAAPYRVANASGVVHLAHTLGRPVVATDVGDLAAAVGHGAGGLVVPPEDPAALAAALVALLADPARATALGDRGQAVLAAASPWAEAAERVEGALLDARPGGAA